MLLSAPGVDLANCVKLRAVGVPLQYILGEWDFYGRTFSVGPGVLIPRPETEILAERAIEFLRRRQSPRALELGAGSGCLAVTLALGTGAPVTAVELSGEAYGYLKRNIARYGAEVTPVLGDALRGLPGRYDLIAANPPYVAKRDIPRLQREVRHEPEAALSGGADGLRFYRGIAEKYRDSLSPGGKLMLEVGFGEADAVAEILVGAGYREIERYRDYSGTERVVTASPPGSAG